MAFFPKFNHAVDESILDVAKKISINLKPGTNEIEQSVIEKARRKVYSSGMNNASKRLMETATEYGSRVGLKDGILRSNLADYARAAGKITPENVDEGVEAMRPILERAKVNPGMMERQLNTMKESAKAEFDAINVKMNDMPKTPEGLFEYYTKTTDDLGQEGFSILGLMKYTGAGVNAYFNPEGTAKAVGRNRKVSAVAGVAALSVGRRYMQGGTLTRDPYGESDIAGVPFI